MFPCPATRLADVRKLKEPELGHVGSSQVLLRGSRATDRKAALNTEKGRGPRKQVPLEAGRGKEQTLALQAGS